MLDVKACQDSSAQIWAHFTWLLFHILARPKLVLPLLASMIALPWLFRQWRWKRQMSGLATVLMVVYLLGASATVARIGNQGLTQLIPSDPGRPADAIVILGRGSQLRASRVKTGVQLWQQQRAPLIFVSGRGDAPIMSHMLAKRGVPERAIEGEPCSATTNENAEYTATLLQAQAVNSIILVTDPPHMLRSYLTFQSLGFEVQAHPSPIPDNFRSPRTRFLVLREWFGLVGYGLMGRYFARSAPSSPWLHG